MKCLKQFKSTVKKKRAQEIIKNEQADCKKTV